MTEKCWCPSEGDAGQSEGPRSDWSLNSSILTTVGKGRSRMAGEAVEIIQAGGDCSLNDRGHSEDGEKGIWSRAHSENGVEDRTNSICS